MNDVTIGDVHEALLGGFLVHTKGDNSDTFQEMIVRRNSVRLAPIEACKLYGELVHEEKWHEEFGDILSDSWQTDLKANLESSEQISWHSLTAWSTTRSSGQYRNKSEALRLGRLHQRSTYT